MAIFTVLWHIKLPHFHFWPWCRRAVDAAGDRPMMLLKCSAPMPTAARAKARRRRRRFRPPCALLTSSSAGRAGVRISRFPASLLSTLPNRQHAAGHSKKAMLRTDGDFDMRPRRRAAGSLIHSYYGCRARRSMKMALFLAGVLHGIARRRPARRRTRSYRRERRRRALSKTRLQPGDDMLASLSTPCSASFLPKRDAT